MRCTVLGVLIAVFTAAAEAHAEESLRDPGALPRLPTGSERQAGTEAWGKLVLCEIPPAVHVPSRSAPRLCQRPQLCCDKGIDWVAGLYAWLPSVSGTMYGEGLRTKFDMSSVDYTEETCIIVVEVADHDGVGQFQTGVVVDTVSEVTDIDRTQIEPTPRFGCRLNTEFILGMGKVKEKVIILLDIDKVLTQEDYADLSQISADVKAAA